MGVEDKVDFKGVDRFCYLVKSRDPRERIRAPDYFKRLSSLTKTEIITDDKYSCYYLSIIKPKHPIVSRSSR